MTETLGEALKETLTVREKQIFEQTGEMLAELGVPIALIDPANLFKDHPLRVDLNPFDGAINTYLHNRPDIVYASENVTHALIPEPADDAKNLYWRDEPRTLIEFAMLALLKRDPKLATPGGVWTIISSPWAGGRPSTTITPRARWWIC